MEAQGKYILLNLDEFEDWLNMQNVTRRISLIQHHHTYIPAYKHFNNTNHFSLCKSMERSHLERGFAEIAQTFTTFPDGKIMACRNLNTIPAGIKGANVHGICIEHVGNFDIGQDRMNPLHMKTILSMTRTLLARFNLTANEKSIVYHHWYDILIGKRITVEGTGTTKSCPGNDFFGGNTIEDFRLKFLPLL